MKKTISRLQFTNYQDPNKTMSQQILEFCAGGGDWVQIQTKATADDHEWTEIRKSSSLCQQHGATLIIDNNIHLALKIDADGVLLNTSTNIAETRKTIGSHKIIGCIAHTYEDVAKIAAQDADYIILDPLEGEKTKQTLNPQAYSTILQACAKHKLSIPTIAVGHITKEDFPTLFSMVYTA
ncbi:thiamine phosphate synthase [Saccharicrinis fermentans]|uniref:Thiamine-phosphate synthase n=1 Tax=Saccharicrinis fermentans DSM 9555 = JCM 21142 TaxID=869213 RepID=W7YTM7_9BACT|nr:thiamine phosphate synthase [Saccharicrinis fermentans]GAF05809.1 thiamine-phosphate synthase [Saccharicrinis fermentans DSM 9555 = JCM 21142]